MKRIYAIAKGFNIIELDKQKTKFIEKGMLPFGMVSFDKVNKCFCQPMFKEFK